MKKAGAELAVYALEQIGVKYTFGIPGEVEDMLPYEKKEKIFEIDDKKIHFVVFSQSIHFFSQFFNRIGNNVIWRMFL